MTELESSIDAIHTFIGERDWDGLNEWLVQTDMSASIVQLLARARTSYVVRSKLPDWEDFVRRVHAQFVERSLDANKLLRGMVK